MDEVSFLMAVCTYMAVYIVLFFHCSGLLRRHAQRRLRERPLAHGYHHGHHVPERRLRLHRPRDVTPGGAFENGWLLTVAITGRMFQYGAFGTTGPEMW